MTVEGIVAALIEATAFAVSPKGKAAAIDVIKSELKVTSDAAAEEGVAELVRIAARKPYPAAERLRRGLAPFATAATPTTTAPSAPTTSAPARLVVRASKRQQLYLRRGPRTAAKNAGGSS